MKKILLLFLSSYVSFTTTAQDIIIKRNGDELQCKILEVSGEEVTYKRWSNPNGPTFKEKKEDIFLIKYENGEKETMTHISPNLNSAISPITFETKVQDTVNIVTTPISNVYLTYTFHRKSQSGLIKWGHMQTEEQAQNILAKDWMDFQNARKKERVGEICIFSGAPFFIMGLFGTIQHVSASKKYSDAKEKYDKMEFEAMSKYDYIYSECLSNAGKYSDDYYIYSDREGYQRYQELCDLVTFNDYKSYKFGYDPYLEQDKNYFSKYKKLTLIPMLGGLTCGSSLIIVGIVKKVRGHKNATRIVNKHIDEYNNSSKDISSSKPEFNIDTKGNNIAFTITF